jgi:hypothetical protein
LSARNTLGKVLDRRARRDQIAGHVVGLRRRRLRFLRAPLPEEIRLAGQRAADQHVLEHGRRAVDAEYGCEADRHDLQDEDDPEFAADSWAQSHVRQARTGQEALLAAVSASRSASR